MKKRMQRERERVERKEWNLKVLVSLQRTLTANPMSEPSLGTCFVERERERENGYYREHRTQNGV